MPTECCNWLSSRDSAQLASKCMGIVNLRAHQLIIKEYYRRNSRILHLNNLLIMSRYGYGLTGYTGYDNHAGFYGYPGYGSVGGYGNLSGWRGFGNRGYGYHTNLAYNVPTYGTHGSWGNRVGNGVYSPFNDYLETEQSIRASRLHNDAAINRNRLAGEFEASRIGGEIDLRHSMRRLRTENEVDWIMRRY